MSNKNTVVQWVNNDDDDVRNETN